MHLFEEGFTQNRELSWLRYNERILDEALDESVPLFERLNYISIFEANLEEFLQVRVGSLIDDALDGDEEKDVRSGMTPMEQLDAIYEMIVEQLEKKEKIFNIVDYQLAKAGVRRLDPLELTATERSRARSFFRQEIKDKLKATIVPVDASLPYIDENKPYIMCKLISENIDLFGLIEMPDKIQKIYVLETGEIKGREMRFILVEDLIKLYADSLFEPFKVCEAVLFDIARNADVQLGEGSDDLMEDMRRVIKKRKTAHVDKLIIENRVSDSLLAFLAGEFDISAKQLLLTNRISVDYADELKKSIPFWIYDDLCFASYKPFNQLLLGHGSVIDRVKHSEMLSAYPFDTMDPLLQLLKESAVDPRVLEIRMTIYRLAAQPQIVKYLEDAAKNGKKVRILMELRARFDEEHNIDWAEELARNDVEVYFGDERYKVHSKLCQIVIDENISAIGKRITGDNSKIRYITQLATGNYNEKTVKFYTDLSLITYDQRIGNDANELFKRILLEPWEPDSIKKKGKKKNKKIKFEWGPTIADEKMASEYDYTMNERNEFLDHLWVSPVNMHSHLIEMIRREADKRENGRILIKCNSITEEKIIEELMIASCVGCKIKLIVRGICCILPGVEYCTENIQVVNVVGRLLEHSRVYVFGEGDDEKMYISSADLMNRNMFKRVEVACPIYGSENRDRIRRIMFLNYFDNVKGRIMMSDGTYSKKKVNGELINSQKILMKENQIL